MPNPQLHPTTTTRQTTGPGKRKIDDALIRTIHQDYSDGMGYGELSKKYGFSRSSIHDAFQRHNLPTALIRVDPLDKRMTPNVVARVTTMYDEGSTLEQVSQAFLGVFTSRDIKRILQKSGVKRRVRSDYETAEQIDRRKYHPIIIAMYIEEHLPVTVIAARLGLPETYCRRTLQRSKVQMRHRNDYNPATYKHEPRIMPKPHGLVPHSKQSIPRQPLIATHKLTKHNVVMPPTMGKSNLPPSMPTQQAVPQMQVQPHPVPSGLHNAQTQSKHFADRQRSAPKAMQQAMQQALPKEAPQAVSPAIPQTSRKNQYTSPNPSHQDENGRFAKPQGNQVTKPHQYAGQQQKAPQQKEQHQKAQQQKAPQQKVQQKVQSPMQSAPPQFVQARPNPQPFQQERMKPMPPQVQQPLKVQQPLPAPLPTAQQQPNRFVERDPERGARLVSPFANTETDAKWELVKTTVAFPTNNGNGTGQKPTQTRFVSRKRKFDSFD
jgi:hypothetical protein